jgi:2-keto-3-deoxy-L-arabinonate dehydratase
MSAPLFTGVFPAIPTTFSEAGELDLASQRRCIDFMIDAGSSGVAILANYSEQFALSDAEREQLTRVIIEHVSGRVPVIVTTTHYSSAVCRERCKQAQVLGASMVMVMPPYHGATIRAGEGATFEFFARLSGAIDIPIMLQDAPMSGTALSAALLARMAREIEHLSYFKIETPQTADKLRQLIALGGDAVVGPWDGEEGITMLADLDAGATGTMPGAGYPDGIRAVFDAHRRGDRDAAAAAYARWLPLINYENRQTGLLTAKILMKEGGVIACEAPRHPFAPATPAARAGLIDCARRLDPLALRWAH